MAGISRHLMKLFRPDVIAIVIFAISLHQTFAQDDEAEDPASKKEEEIASGGATGKVLVAINDSFQNLKPFVKSWFMTFLSFCFVAQWHVVPMITDETKPSKFWRQIGLNVFVFQIYYAPQFHFLSGKNFVASIGFIFFDTVMIFYFFSKVLKPSVREYLGVEQDGEEKVTELCADNWYKDITRQFRHCMLCFFAQSGLVMYYVFELNSDPKTHEESAVSMLEWIVALLIIEIAGDDEMGSSYESKYWDKLVKDMQLSGQHWHFIVWSIPVPVWLELRLRQAMDMVINGMFRTMILGTAPIMLAVEDHMDFVKDCTALFFILKLDDIDAIELLDPDNLDKITDKIKHCGSSPLLMIDSVRDWVNPKKQDFSDLVEKDLKNASNRAQKYKRDETSTSQSLTTPFLKQDPEE